MKVFIGSVITALTIALIAGVILLAVEYGVFVPQNEQTVAATSPPEVIEPPVTPGPSAVETEAVDEDADEQVEPQPVDNSTFTDYRIEVVGRKLSATEYAAEQPPGYYMKVFTAAGEVGHREDCYAHLELYNNEVLLTTGDTKCGLQGGWSTSWWPNGTRLDDGTVRVTASITSDWGATAYTETSFIVRND